MAHKKANAVDHVPGANAVKGFLKRAVNAVSDVKSQATSYMGKLSSGGNKVSSGGNIGNQSKVDSVVRVGKAVSGALGSHSTKAANLAHAAKDAVASNVQRNVSNLSEHTQRALNKGQRKVQAASKVVKTQCAQHASNIKFAPYTQKVVKTTQAMQAHKLAQNAADIVSKLSATTNQAYTQGKRYSAHKSAQAAHKISSGAAQVSRGASHVSQNAVQASRRAVQASRSAVQNLSKIQNQVIKTTRNLSSKASSQATQVASKVGNAAANAGNVWSKASTLAAQATDSARSSGAAACSQVRAQARNVSAQAQELLSSGQRSAVQGLSQISSKAQQALNSLKRPMQGDASSRASSSAAHQPSQASAANQYCRVNSASSVNQPNQAGKVNSSNQGCCSTHASTCCSTHASNAHRSTHATHASKANHSGAVNQPLQAKAVKVNPRNSSFNLSGYEDQAYGTQRALAGRSDGIGAGTGYGTGTESKVEADAWAGYGTRTCSKVGEGLSAGVGTLPGVVAGASTETGILSGKDSGVMTRAGASWWRMLGVLTLCGCSILSVGLLSGCEQEAKTSYTPSLAEAVYEVSTIHPQFKNRERSFMLNGRISAYTRADVRPQVDGIILQRLFTEGTQVEEGTPLYEIDPAPFKAALEHAQASYERAIVQRKMAAKDYERFELLYRKRSASEKERDDALLAYELAQADEKLYKSALDTAQISLNYTKVSAPISGIIGVSKVTRGALVNANQSEPLATIIDLDKVYVDLEQSALEWRKLREGLLTGNIYLTDQAYDVSLYFQDSALYPHLGNLSLSEVLVDEVSGAVALRAVFDNPEHLLLPGMAVMCKLNGGVAQNIMTLPAQAVLRDPKGNAYVYTVQGDRAVQTSVKIGELYNDGWQILDGLDSTYEVVISGAASLTHGSKVKVVNQDGVDLTTTTSDQVKDPDAAVQAVTKPNISSSGLGNSSVNVP